MTNHPDCPEAVALVLLDKILERDDEAKRNEPPAARMLNLYAQCLEAAMGRREAPELGAVH